MKKLYVAAFLLISSLSFGTALTIETEEIVVCHATSPDGTHYHTVKTVDSSNGACSKSLCKMTGSQATKFELNVIKINNGQISKTSIETVDCTTR